MVRAATGQAPLSSGDEAGAIRSTSATSPRQAGRTAASSFPPDGDDDRRNRIAEEVGQARIRSERSKNRSAPFPRPVQTARRSRRARDEPAPDPAAP